MLLELAILFSGLQGAHHRVAASLSLLVDVNAMCINNNITSNIFSSFNNIDPSHMMLIDFCLLCCQGCGPIGMVQAWVGQKLLNITF